MASTLQQPEALLKPFANSGDRNIIPEEDMGTQRASLDEGFPYVTGIPVAQGGIPPERKDFNALGYLLSSQYFFLQNGGNFTFNQDVSDAIGGYPLNAVLQYMDTDTGEFYQVRSLLNNNTYNFVATPSYIDGEKWIKVNSPSSRQLGEIVSSTIPLTDAGLHLLDGSLLSGSGIYSHLVTHIGGLVSSYPSLFVSESVWQSEIASNGICGKFVYDSVNNTLRLPKFGNKMVTGNADLITVGAERSPKSNQIWGTTTTNSTLSFMVDVANSFNEYYYIVVATSTKTDIEIDIDQITADLAQKADKVDTANTDLSNLTSQGQNIANWSNNVTNCITEIPQDIKLELNNGTLTLKAGSKVYVPNGSGVFDEVIITSDMQISPSDYASLKHILCVLPNNTIQLMALDTQQYSGSTPPRGLQYMFWYDTANNYVKYTTDSGSTWQSGWCLPLAIATITNGTGVTSIDQVFNGFGYIGSTVFALPNLKVAKSTGRNADGTLNSTLVTNTSVQTMTFVSANLNAVLCFGGSLTANTDYRYDEPSNYVYNGSTRWDSVPLAQYTMDANGKIDSFIPRTVFHALDYNDTPHIIDTYVNGNSGYIIYSPDVNGNKRCIQWGVSPRLSNYSIVTVSLLKPIQFPYVVQANIEWLENPGWYTGTFYAEGRAVTDISAQPTLKTNTTFTMQSFSQHSWRIDGYLYEG